MPQLYFTHAAKDSFFPDFVNFLLNQIIIIDY